MSRSRKHHQYYKSRAFDKSCRCHGAFSYCRNNRQAAVKRQEAAADESFWDGGGVTFTIEEQKPQTKFIPALAEQPSGSGGRSRERMTG